MSEPDSGGPSGTDSKDKPDFEAVPREAEKFIFLAECAKLQTSGTLWTKEQDVVGQTRALQMAAAQRILILSTPPQVDLDKLKAAVQNNTDFFVNLAHPTANLFFRSPMRAADSRQLIFSVPEKLFRVQRRQSFRLAMKGNYSLTVDFQSPTDTAQKTTKRVLDLSDTGMAFLISNSEEAIFQKGLILKNFHFILNKQNLTMEAEVRYSKPMGREAKDFSKVGVKFVSISQEDAWFVASYVLAENRRLVSNSI
ncbi:MAG: PilZ domain-containing protein [Bdellovibrio sp.]|nr:PilZ domain-containing protein [Bdellovibrio sp.]